MPTYEYICEKCKCRFEQVQRITAESLKTCPKCKGRVHRLISGGSGFILKGSGFYATDYGRKGKKPSEEGEAAATKDTGKIDPAKDKKKD
jgi:putative FmdB family regulatory protein